MTTTTRMLAKGIPPRLHEPKPKPRTKKSNTKTVTTHGSHKRATRDSDDESGPDDDSSSLSDDSETARRAKKKAGKQRRVEVSDSEVEIVDDNKRPGKAVEEVDDGVDDEQRPDEQEVSPYHRPQASLTHYTQNDGLNDHQRGADLQEKPVKKESTLDLLTIMTDKVTVKFKTSAVKHDTLIGRWCTVCK